MFFAGMCSLCTGPVVTAVMITVDSILALTTTFCQSNATAGWCFLIVVTWHDDARRQGVNNLYRQ